MSKVNICDRCKKVMRAETLFGHSINRFHDQNKKGQFLDLCHDCVREFMKFTENCIPQKEAE